MTMERIAIYIPVIVMLALAACDPSPTVVELSVVYDDSWSLSELRVATDTETSTIDARHDVRILVPEQWVGNELAIEMWGMRADDAWAHGSVSVTPVVDQVVAATITLNRLPCGAWCQLGATTCIGDGVAICEQRDDDSCYEWSEPVECGDGTPYCSAGQCSASCIDECVEGETRCAGAGGYQRCGNADSDECTDWLAVEACDAPQVCSNGSCQAMCQDECTSGDTTCTGGGVAACADFNADGCTEWGPQSPCSNGSCSGGQCQTACTDDCSSATCTNLVWHACGQFDFDSCMDLSPGTSCAPGDACQEGACDAQAGCSSTPKICDQVPEPECVGTDTLRTFYGACDGGTCSYPYSDTPCTGCNAGACECSGTCASVTIESNQSGAYDITADETHIYWTAANANVVMRRVKTMASPAEIVATGQGGASSIAVDATHVYWTNFTDGTVMRRAKTLTSPPEQVATSQAGAEGIVVDTTHIYWTNMDADTVARRVKTLAAPVELVAADQNGAYHIAVDDAHVYWTTYDGWTVMRRVKTLLAPSQMVADAQPRAAALALDATHVFWVTSEPSSNPSAPRRLMRASKVLGTIDVVEEYTQTSSRIQAIALDDEYVYWADPADGEMFRKPKSAGASTPREYVADTVLALPYQSYVFGILVDAAHVYWTVQDLMSGTDEVRRISRCACGL
ncbi:MAG: hypothetical protein AB7L28_26000 [Kofleriaceae bacterium]